MNIAMPPLLSVLVLAAVLTILAQAVQMPPQSPPSLEKRDFSAEFERMKVFARNYPNWKPVDLSKVIGSRLSQSLSVEKMLAGSKFIKNNVAVGASHVAVDPIKIMEVKPVKVLQNQLQKTHEQITMLKITNQVAPATIISSSGGSDKVEKQQLEPFRRIFPVSSFSHSKKPFTLDWWLPNIKKYTPPTTTQPTTFKTQKPVFGNKLFNISSLLTPLLNQTAGIFFLDKNLTTGNFGFPFFLRARNMTLNLTLNRTSSSIRLFFPFPFLKQSKLEKVLKSSSKSVETEVEEAEKPKKVSKRQFGGSFGGGGFNGGGGFGGGFNNGGFGGGGFGGGGFGGGGGFRHHGGSNFNNNNGGGGGFGGSNFNNNNGGGGFGGSSFNNNNAIGGGFGGSNFNNNNAGGGFGGDNFNNNNGKR